MKLQRKEAGDNMQRISVTRLVPGMKAARNVFDADGRVLVAAGVVLKNSYINRLKELGVGSVYIQADELPAVEIPEVIKEETRIKAVQVVKNTFQSFRTTKQINFKQFVEIAATIVEEIMGSGDTLLHLSDIRTYDDYTFSHSVNVCILSVLMGSSKNYDMNRLKDLALGALLHDVGKVLVPIEILNKPGRLTLEEFSVVKNHAELGFELLRKQQDQVPLLACHVAYQHQEKFDGSGYPRQLKGDQIHEYARIAAIADVYDALTSDRPYRKGLLPHEAYEIMMASGNTHFEMDLLQKFFNKIAIYPLGSIVRLNTGDIGIVTDVIPDLPTRPKVQIITNRSGEVIKKLKEINLVEQLTVFVEQVFTEEEAFQWMGTVKKQANVV